MSFWQKPCHYCGGAITTVGIDRIDNTKGYAMNNCVSCCRTCNIAKGAMSPSDFMTHAKKIVEHNQVGRVIA